MQDLSLRHGILPERVKAVCWQREYFWNVVYPKMGETGLRLALELEFMAGEEDGFCDYGLDLAELERNQRGIRVYKLHR